MRKFIKYIVGFLIPIFLLAYPLDFFISKELSKSNAYLGELEVMSDIYNGRINADIAIYGSSRARVQINPSILEDSFNKTAYNFGMDGQPFGIQYLRHKAYFSHNKAPQTIIAIMEFYSFKKLDGIFMSEQFLPFMLNNEVLAQSDQFKNTFDWYDFHIPLIRYKGKYKALGYTLKSMFRKKDTKFRTNGFKPNDIEWKYTIEMIEKRMSSFDISIDEEYIILFKKFMEECQSQNIKVIMVYPPEYIEGQHFLKNRDLILSTIQDLSESYNIPFIDYSNDLISKDKNLFYNVTHLNQKGADIFTKKLASDIKQLGGL